MGELLSQSFGFLRIPQPFLRAVNFIGNAVTLQIPLSLLLDLLTFEDTAKVRWRWLPPFLAFT